MEVVYRRCCGLDVHKRTVVACLLLLDESGQRTQKKREFGTFRSDLIGLMRWLFLHKVTHVAMESTGVYWKPVWNVLELTRRHFRLLLVNPAQVKALPGKKTDRRDAQRICGYLQQGLLRGSLVPGSALSMNTRTPSSDATSTGRHCTPRPIQRHGPMA